MVIKYEMKACMEYYFKNTSNGEWECKNCQKKYKQQMGNGYTNLQNHLKIHDSQWKQTFEDVLKNSGGGTLHSFGFINGKTNDLFKWIRWIVDRNLPLHEIEQHSTREVVSMRPFSIKTLKKYMEGITTAVENLIKQELPDKFALVFDGWTRFNTHYLAIFAMYLDGNQQKAVLLAIAPPIDEESYDADEHITFIEHTLDIYGKCLKNVCVLSADNCETNRSISRKTNIPLVGCSSHKFNLAVKHHLESPEHRGAIKAVHDLMVELRKLKNAAKLRKLGVQAPKLENETRWSSTFNMLKRYFEIFDAVETIGTMSIQDKLPTRVQHRHLEELMVQLKQMEDITKELQRQDLTLDEARDLFDGTMDLFPDMEQHLGVHAHIVEDPTFESAVVKVLRKEEQTLTPSEKEKLRPFQKSRRDKTTFPRATYDDQLNFAQRILKKRRTSKTTEEGDYIDLSFIPPTSNVVERLFSAGKLILRDQRASLSPYVFEMLLFLKVNRDWWNVQTLHKLMHSTEAGASNDL